MELQRGKTDSMYVVHGTKKLLDRVGGPTTTPETTSTTWLGSWYATVVFWRPQVVVFVNEETLLPLLVPLAPATTVLERFPDRLARHLQLHEVDDWFIEHELIEMRDHHVAKTANRTVLGVMNGFIALANHRRGDVGKDDLFEESFFLAQTPCGPLSKTHIAPDAALQARVAR